MRALDETDRAMLTLFACIMVFIGNIWMAFFRKP
jgi:hypothetical protein